MPRGAADSARTMLRVEDYSKEELERKKEEAEGRDLPVGERLQITTPESGEEEVRWEEKKCSQYLSGKGGSLDFSAWGELAQD